MGRASGRAEAKMILPGWALASAMRSFTDLTPSAGATTSTLRAKPDLGDAGEVLERVVRQAWLQRRADRKIGRLQERVAVRRGLGDHARRQHASPARPIVHDHRPSPALAHFLRRSCAPKCRAGRRVWTPPPDGSACSGKSFARPHSPRSAAPIRQNRTVCASSRQAPQRVDPRVPVAFSSVESPRMCGAARLGNAFGHCVRRAETARGARAK